MTRAGANEPLTFLPSESPSATAIGVQPRIMDVVVVESPAKARTINKYLGKNFRVVASYGHVRDLAARNGSVDPDNDFSMVWEIQGESEKHLKEIAQAIRGADHLYLATDPDREGEAISWHVREVLRNRKALNGINVQRIVFHEVTRDAILEALKHPRDVDHALVEAYLARRALDYLVGFTLSPVLWRKLPGSRSAGRVQSVALRLVCERESEIEAFRPREYWTVDTDFATAGGATLTARLTHLDGARLDRYALAAQADADRAAAAIRAGAFRVASIEKKEVTRGAQPPFTTSTLQQEASRKLGFGASRTMRIAQRLYEGVDLGGETVGLITYMRTDSVNMANEAVAACRRLIGSRFGDSYVPERPNAYKSRAKNAQEAHEAVRPTDVFRRPDDVARFLDADGRRLYELIWKRTVASQMKRAVLEQVGIDVATADRATVLRATGSVILFDGFLRLYQEDRDDPADDDENRERILPKVGENESVGTGEVRPEQHFTKPPPRYSEASLVRRLEELGIGRPSTYASILSVLQDRGYVRLESRRFIPEDIGRVVTAFLSGYFDRYVQYGFTADLEDKLDRIASGEAAWIGVLREFWEAFYQAVQDTATLKMSEVIETLDEDLGPHFFPVTEKNPVPRECPACRSGRLGLKLGRGGPFIGCSNYPECTFTRPLTVSADDETAAVALPRELGTDPETGMTVAVRKGPFGVYVQLGEAQGKEKPRRAGLPKGLSPLEVTLEQALALLSLPRTVGRHPEDGETILAGLGRFGPYLKHGTRYASLGAEDDVLTIGLNRAVTVLAEKPARRGAEVLREMGPHPGDEKPVVVYKGRYGPYVKHGRVNASLPKDVTPEELTMEQAAALLAARAAKGGGRKPRTARTAKATKTAKAAKTAKGGRKAAGSGKTGRATEAAG